MTFTLNSAPNVSKSAEVWFELRLYRCRLVRCFETLEQAAEILFAVGLISAALRDSLFLETDKSLRVHVPRGYDVSFLPWLDFDLEIAR